MHKDNSIKAVGIDKKIYRWNVSSFASKTIYMHRRYTWYRDLNGTNTVNNQNGACSR